MKQLIQNFKTGKLSLEEVPIPYCKEGYVLVENAYSLISAGTEKSTVEMGKASLLDKAKKRPDLVEQVLQNIQKEGIWQTFKKVTTKLDAPKALGYSCAGVVLESRGPFAKGDRVACAGQDYAGHAEVVAVPKNLVVKIPEEVSFEEAAFVSLGAIALQGIRRAEAGLGEKVAVIGLGLLGQLTAQLLKANGCSVFGIDLSGFSLEIAQKSGIDQAGLRNDENLPARIDAFTNGYGFDKVIVAASSSDNDPVVLAVEIARQKGIIVVLGNLKLDIPREPHFYKKELQVRMSTSCGPGRYDASYEEKGQDYPYAYVRFTEQRNMETFLNLVAAQSVRLKPLITDVFDFANALQAYDLILQRQRPFVGVLLKYPHFVSEKTWDKKTRLSPVRENRLKVGFIGTGSFAQGYLLPALKRQKVGLHTAVAPQGIKVKNVAKKFGFSEVATDPQEVFDAPDINVVFIASPHQTHAAYVQEALKQDKHVFVEKPLCITPEELKAIAQAYDRKNLLMVGFNRRFAPVSVLIKERLKQFPQPIIMTIRVNAGALPAEHWSGDTTTSGGRIVGEACHFIDLMSYFSGSIPRSVNAQGLPGLSSDGNRVITLAFDNGSAGSLIYTDCGGRSMGKERIEIFAGGISYVIDDFKQGLIYKNRRKQILRNKGKGHREEIAAFLTALREGKESPISFESLCATTLATFKINESLKNGLPCKIDLGEFFQ